MNKVPIQLILVLFITSCSSKKYKRINSCKEQLSIEKYSHNSMQIDYQLKTCLDDLIIESYSILKEMQSENVTEIHRRLMQSTYASSITYDSIASQIRLVSDLLKKNGMPSVDSINISSSFPLYQLYDKPENSVTLSFPLGDRTLMQENEVRIGFSLVIDSKGYFIVLNDILYRDAQSKREFIDFLNNGG